MSNEVNKDTQESKEELKKFSEFAQVLDKAGLFPRAYDIPNLEKLYYAAEQVHKHLCTLDTGYYKEARGVKLISLANAYAECHNGLRQLE